MWLRVKPSNCFTAINMKNVKLRKCKYLNHANICKLEKILSSICTSVSVYVHFMIKAYLINILMPYLSPCLFVHMVPQIQHV